MAEVKKNRRKIERCALEFYLIGRCALCHLGRTILGGGGAGAGMRRGMSEPPGVDNNKQ